MAVVGVVRRVVTAATETAWETTVARTAEWTGPSAGGAGSRAGAWMTGGLALARWAGAGVALEGAVAGVPGASVALGAEDDFDLPPLAMAYAAPNSTIQPTAQAISSARRGALLRPP